MRGSLLGPEFNDEEIKKFLDKNSVNFKKLSDDDLYQSVSDEIIIRNSFIYPFSSKEESIYSSVRKVFIFNNIIFYFWFNIY